MEVIHYCMQNMLLVKDTIPLLPASQQARNSSFLSEREETRTESNVFQCYRARDFSVLSLRPLLSPWPPTQMHCLRKAWSSAQLSVLCSFYFPDFDLRLYLLFSISQPYSITFVSCIVPLIQPTYITTNYLSQQRIHLTVFTPLSDLTFL